MRSKIFKVYCAILSVLCGVAGLVVAYSSDAAVIGANPFDVRIVFLESLSLFYVVALSVVSADETAP